MNRIKFSSSSNSLLMRNRRSNKINPVLVTSQKRLFSGYPPQEVPVAKNFATAAFLLACTGGVYMLALNKMKQSDDLGDAIKEKEKEKKK